MRQWLVGLVTVATLISTPSWAGVYADGLTKCIVDSSSDSDQLVFVQFMFSAMAQHPALKAMANIDPVAEAKLEQDAATLLGRLIFSDCRSQVIAALKNEGFPAFSSSFSALGEAAMRRLANDPAVMAKFGSMVLQPGFSNQLGDLFNEAGVPMIPGVGR